MPTGKWRRSCHPGANAFEFTAPNLQYLIDSPAEFGPVSIRQFEVNGRTFRVAVHHTGTAAELDGFVKDVEKIVRQEGAIFGDYPSYEPGTYTFLADYLPYASGDGMEHRNSTVITSSGSIRASRDNLLDTVAHEFFHNWNVERIRPRSLEPFDLERVNMSGELWLAEGFTEYYGPLALSRSGLADLTMTTGTLGQLIATVVNNPGRTVRSAEDMSRMAPFHRRRPDQRSHQLAGHLQFPTIRLAARLRSRSICRCAVGQVDGWTARRLHARDVADARQARWHARGLRRSSLHDR
jgi:predicted metalloprotease with PDZ domain